MKTDHKLTRFMGFLLGFLGSFGGIGSIVTGLRFEKISLPTVAFFCIVAAVVTAVFAGRKLLAVAAAGFLLASLWSWLKGALNLSLEAFLNHISRLYDLGYGWGTIRWSTAPLDSGMAQPVLCALGILSALGIGWSFLRCKGIWLSVLLVSLPVVPCMLLVDTPPSAPYFFIQLLCVTLLLMVRLARKRRQDAALIKLLVLPAAAALLVLFLCIPQKTYASFQPVDQFLGYIQEFFSDSSKEPPKTPVTQEGSWVNLSTVGPKEHDPRVIMDLTTDESGYLYLKGAAYDTYSGTWWDCTAAPPAIPLPQTDTHRVTVTTRQLHDVLYLPYCAFGIGNDGLFHSESDGQVANTDNWRSYTVQYRALPAPDALWQAPSAEVRNTYTQLPAATRRNALDYLAWEIPQLPDAVWSRAQAIVRHVSHSADYSLQTQSMPTGEQDFALWFLEQSDTGYCVHFATAATVLLRAAGIPCRYVTGYLVSAQADRSVEVQQQNSHAWVECLIDGVGWIPLEPTPGNGILETLGTETTPPTVVTTPEQTTEMTEPSQITEAPENTVPSASATVPSTGTGNIGDTDSPNSQPSEPRAKLLWLSWILYPLCAVGAVLGQWRLRLKLRQNMYRRGKRNAQALARWQLVVLHCRVRKQQPDSRLHELAQKARFSHHTVTREELREFDDWIASSTQQLRQLNLWKQFLATVILALY